MNARARGRRGLAVLGVAGLVLVTSAHVGTLDVFFRGDAGPYPVQVTVRPPGVVPGLAQIHIRTADTAITRVTTQAAVWSLGARGAPAPDDARRSAGDPAFWTSELWVMTGGSYAINVSVTGPAGVGEVTVPFSSVATRQLPMSRSLGAVLGGLGAFLVAGLVSIIGTAARESIVAPGTPMTPRHRRRGRLAMLGGVAVLALALSGGRRWWNAVDAAYARNLFRPMEADVQVSRTDDGALLLRLVITDSLYADGRRRPIIPDHGKPIHLFLVGASDRRPLGHFHPAQLDAVTFAGSIPGLPAGDYRYYADVVQESGFAQTLTGRVTVPEGPPRATLDDPDDAVFPGAPTGDSVMTVEGGLRVTFARPTTRAGGDDVLLRFAITDSTGNLVTVEPYLGMPGHAIVARDDGEVFAHLHSNGSFSMAAQAVLEAVARGDTLPSTVPNVPRPRLGEHPAAHAPTAPGELTFPFAFPSPGRYAVWVQFRRGPVRTAAFSLDVP